MPEIRRDYDSVLGFTQDLTARGAIFIFILPSPARTLTRRVHFKAKFIVNGQVRHNTSSIKLDTKSPSTSMMFAYHSVLVGLCNSAPSTTMSLTTHESFLAGHFFFRSRNWTRPKCPIFFLHRAPTTAMASKPFFLASFMLREYLSGVGHHFAWQVRGPFKANGRLARRVR